MHINAKKLITLRKRLGLSAEGLAEEAKVGRATITRIENGHTQSSSSHTVKALAKALRCSPEDLSSPLEARDAEMVLGDHCSMAVNLSASSQNALAMIAKRYNVKEETILEFAPLLFDIIARESLTERRKNLADLQSARTAIDSMSDRFPHIGDRFTYDWEADEFGAREERSIARCDLRGDYVHSDDLVYDNFYPSKYDEDSQNPFVTHLRQRYAQITAEGYEGADIVAVDRTLAPTYELGFSEAKEFAGGDEDLAKAIVRGKFVISAMPKELLDSHRMAERQQWMRQQRDIRASRILALLKDLEIEFDESGLFVE